jgi:hypothetical protein
MNDTDAPAEQDRLARAAKAVEGHPDFETVRKDSALWEHATAADGLDSQRDHFWRFAGRVV